MFAVIPTKGATDGATGGSEDKPRIQNSSQQDSDIASEVGNLEQQQPACMDVVSECICHHHPGCTCSSTNAEEFTQVLRGEC